MLLFFLTDNTLCVSTVKLSDLPPLFPFYSVYRRPISTHYLQIQHFDRISELRSIIWTPVARITNLASGIVYYL
ncbi:hypothetical protein L1887_32613 [Cichorium endivia]|nr:hypothetical protein L1887_32613 [Cichorium endivia]